MKRLAIFALAMTLSACTQTTSLNVPTTHYDKSVRALNSSLPNTLPHLTSIGDVNDYVNRRVKYRADKDDYWQSVQETLKRGTADCEDYAIAKRGLILYNGLANKEDMQVLLVFDRFKRVAHAVLVVKGQVLDNQNKRIVSVSSSDFLVRYQPLTYANQE